MGLELKIGRWMDWRMGLLGETDGVKKGVERWMIKGRLAGW